MAAPIASRRIPCLKSELRLDKTLACGQSFRWKERTPGVWSGVLRNHVWLLRQTDSDIFYDVYSSSSLKLEPNTVCPQTLQNFNIEVKKEPACLDDHEVTNFIIENSTNKHEDVKTEEKVCIRETLSRIVRKSHNSKEKHAKKKEKDQSSLQNNAFCVYDDILKDYFQLDVSLAQLYSAWSKADPNFKAVSTNFEGIRILRQDPVENLFAFICSSNNNISRISGMVENLCSTYGNKIMNLEGEPFYSFPPVNVLAGKEVEERLRQLGFGYRAKYISQTAKHIIENENEGWLLSLRGLPYLEARKELLKLQGVGPKVADCVCLMSLDKLESVPVDTHVWQIAARNYLPQLKNVKSLTDKLYQQIGDHFRSVWGEKAGWAQSVMFAADLRHFKEPAMDKEKKSLARKQDQGLLSPTGPKKKRK